MSARRIRVLLFVLTLKVFCGPVVLATEPKSSGLNELVILDPAAHARSAAAVQLRPTETGLKIDIPPFVHVHRMYFSGRREFQGPFVAGGPTIVVASHPKTNCRMYIETVLPAGYPKIVYDDDTITYLYPDQRVRIEFHKLICRDSVTVRYLSGRGICRRVHEGANKTALAMKTAVDQSQVARAIAQVAHGGGQVVSGAVGMTGSVASGTITMTGNAVATLPGVPALKSIAAEQPFRGSVEANAKAETQMQRQSIQYGATLR